MTQKVDKQTGKRPYSKPELKQVQFVREEVVFAACKFPFPAVGRDQDGHLRACQSNHCQTTYASS